jgi:ankyrin repeat protein
MYSWFPAILQGDDVRAREILEVFKSRGCPDPANQLIDATGDAGLLGGINYGHLNIVKLLLEYGANPNQVCNVPTIRGLNMTYFNMAMFSYDIVAEKKGQEVAEGIVNTLLDGGADIHTMAIGRGTPLSAAVKIYSNHAARMRITRKLLEKGADPNQIIRNDSFPGTRNESLILPSACTDVLGKYSETDRREIVQLLLDYGADPGKYVTIDCRGETCNTIHVVVSRRQNDILRMLLSCEKGRTAVNARRSQKVQYPEENNGNGETAITMCVACDDLERYKASRDMAVQLLRAGADIDIEDHIGLSASLWLLDRHPEKPHAKKKELHGLVEKAKKYGPSFWDDSDEVKAFIEEGESEVVCCDNCGCWNNQEFADGRKLNTFQRCSRCKKVYYCSKACQKARWKVHKKSCIQCD